MDVMCCCHMDLLLAGVVAAIHGLAAIQALMYCFLELMYWSVAQAIAHILCGTQGDHGTLVFLVLQFFKPWLFAQSCADMWIILVCAVKWICLTRCAVIVWSWIAQGSPI
ncbi:hypothetical protein U1Q18_049498 [Sarracenia purpurea var. burkii]